ncbi:MAG: hypothetical protein JWM82_2530, partial [Myxococcales bacterium]|nr:hypothetical protein [Myxococcales bacterium]
DGLAPAPEEQLGPRVLGRGARLHERHGTPRFVLPRVFARVRGAREHEREGDGGPEATHVPSNTHRT